MSSCSIEVKILSTFPKPKSTRVLPARSLPLVGASISDDEITLSIARKGEEVFEERLPFRNSSGYDELAGFLFKENDFRMGLCS